MKPGSVIVDVSIDQGGCLETSRSTSHADPVYTVDGVLHYCVTNMPAAVPHTSTFALTNATIPYVLAIAGGGLERACAQSPAIYEGVNTYRGRLTCAAVAGSQGRPWSELRPLL
jgi:alanine dehydrogenase